MHIGDGMHVYPSRWPLWARTNVIPYLVFCYSTCVHVFHDLKSLPRQTHMCLHQDAEVLIISHSWLLLHHIWCLEKGLASTSHLMFRKRTRLTAGRNLGRPCGCSTFGKKTKHAGTTFPLLVKSLQIKSKNLALLTFPPKNQTCTTNPLACFWVFQQVQ